MGQFVQLWHADKHRRRNMEDGLAMRPLAAWLTIGDESITAITAILKLLKLLLLLMMLAQLQRATA